MRCSPPPPLSPSSPPVYAGSTLFVLVLARLLLRGTSSSPAPKKKRRALLVYWGPKAYKSQSLSTAALGYLILNLTLSYILTLHANLILHPHTTSNPRASLRALTA